MTNRERVDANWGVGVNKEFAYTLADELDKALGIIAQHDLCHDLHGKVNAIDFANGCAKEQYKIYGCVPDRDKIEELKLIISDSQEYIIQLEEEINTLNKLIFRKNNLTKSNFNV